MSEILRKRYSRRCFSGPRACQSAWPPRALQAAERRPPARRAAKWRRSSLRSFYLIPDFVVLGAARHILPKIDSLHVGVGIVHMEIFLFGVGHKRGGLGIRRRVAGHLGDLFLRLRFDH